MRARGVMEEHRRRRHDCCFSVFAFDFLFIDESGLAVEREAIKDGPESNVVIKVLVAHELLSGFIFVHVVDKKGVDEENYDVDVFLDGIKCLGYQCMAVKSDN